MAKTNANELPAGRLAGFEDDDTGDLAGILGPRRGKERRVAAVPDPVEAPTPVAAKPAAVETAQPKRGGAAKKVEPKKRSTPAKSEAANEIRSSSVHIPTSLLEKLVSFRDGHGMSNGQVVIAAIEDAHPQLKDLIHPATAGGGGLFAQRATRGVRTVDGPLTPLNVRLFAADYEVIDQLVEEFGAYSRGHLVTVCLSAFFETQEQ